MKEMQHSEHEESLTSNDVWGMFLRFKCFIASLSSEHSNSLWGRCYACTHCKCKQLSPKHAEKNQTNCNILGKKKKKRFRTENFMSKVLHTWTPVIVTVHSNLYWKQDIQSQIQYFGQEKFFWFEWFGCNRIYKLIFKLLMIVRTLFQVTPLLHNYLLVSTGNVLNSLRQV